MFIIQNDADILASELNMWTKLSLDEIQKVEESHKRIIKNLQGLREETINYLKSQEVIET